MTTSDRSAKALISQVLAQDIAPTLRRYGFDRRSRRVYERVRDGHSDLIQFQQRGPSFTAVLGVFVTEVDEAVSLLPSPVRPEWDEWHIRCDIEEVGPDGHLRRDPRDAGPGGWDVDAQTDLSRLGAEVRQQVEQNGLGFLEYMATPDGVLAWLHQKRYLQPWPVAVALATYAGDRALAQEVLDWMVTWAPPGPNPILRNGARLAGRLGLVAPPLTDAPALTITFRLPADTAPKERYDAFHALNYKFRLYVEQWRRLLPDPSAMHLYHTAQCTGDTCTITLYGDDPEVLRERLRRAEAKLSDQFAEITWVSS